MLDVITLTLLSRIAAAQLAELDRVLLDTLAELGSMLDFAHVMIFASTEDCSDLCVRLTWSAPSSAPVPLSRIQDAFPELVERILAGELVEVRRVGDLRIRAPKDFAFLRSLGLRSALVLPLGLGGTVDGALVLAGMGRAKHWPTELVGELRTLGHAMAMGLHRHHDPGALAAQAARPGHRPGETMGLTERQLEVLRLLGRGHTMKQIAELLDISPRTVAFHKARIKETMGASTMAELLQKAMRASVLEP